VQVTVGGPGYGISLEYSKEVTDTFGVSRRATTWRSGSIGTPLRSRVARWEQVILLFLLSSIVEHSVEQNASDIV